MKLSSDGPSSLQVNLDSTEFGQDHKFTITVDPKGAIPESNESNNVLSVTVKLPTKVTGSGDVPCFAS